VLAALLALAALPAAAQDAPAPTPEEIWPLIGYRRVTSSGRAVLHVDTGEGRVSAVRFQAQQRGVTIDRVRFELVAGEPIEMRVHQVIRAGERGPEIALPPSVELRIVRVDVRVLPGHGAATLNLLGAPH